MSDVLAIKVSTMRGRQAQHALRDADRRRAAVVAQVVAQADEPVALDGRSDALMRARDAAHVGGLIEPSNDGRWRPARPKPTAPDTDQPKPVPAKPKKPKPVPAKPKKPKPDYAAVADRLVALVDNAEALPVTSAAAAAALDVSQFAIKTAAVKAAADSRMILVSKGRACGMYSVDRPPVILNDALLNALGDAVKNADHCPVSRDYLREATGASNNTLDRAIAEAKARGLIESPGIHAPKAMWGYWPPGGLAEAA